MRSQKTGRKPEWLRLIVLLGAFGFYLYLSWPAEPVHDLVLDGETAFLALGRAGLAIIDLSNPAEPQQLAVFDSLGDARAVSVSDQYAYLADGNQGLRLVDISQLSRPVEVGVYKRVRQVLDVEVVGDRVFLATGREGLKLLEVAGKDPPVRFQELGHYTPGPSIQKVTVVGDMAYLVAGNRTLRVVQVSRPGQIDEVTVIDLDSEIDDLQVDGHLLYLAAGNAGVIIFDISNPAEPKLFQRISISGTVKDLFVEGGSFVYLAAGRDGLRVLDLSSPDQVNEIGSYHFPLNANQVLVKDGKIYLADREVGLFVLDARVQTGFQSTTSDEKQRGDAVDVAVDERYAYLASSGQGLRVIDLTDLQTPEEVVDFGTEGQPNGVTLAGNFIILSDGPIGVHVLFLTEGERGAIEVQEKARRDTPGSAMDSEVVGQLLYLADGPEGLGIYSLRDPADLRELGRERFPGWAYDVAVLGDYAYVAAGEAGLRVINVLDPALPAEVGSLDTPGEAHGLSVQRRPGNPEQILVFLADGPGGLRVIDVTNPRSPHELVSFNLGDFAQDIRLAGDHAYITTHERGLRVVSIADLAQMRETGTFDTPGKAYGLDLFAGHAFIADFNRGLRILSLEDPANPKEVSFFEIHRSVRKVFVQDDLALLSDAESGFRIADMIDPRRPREIGHYDQGGLVEDFAIRGEIAFIASATGLQAVHIADPRNPVPISGLRTIGRPFALSLAGDHAYLAVGEFGLQIVDIHDPADMRLSSLYETPGLAQDVYLSGNYAYIADGEAGLEIILISDPQEPRTASVLDQFKDARSVVVSSGYAYLADGPNGIWVIDVQEPVQPRIVELIKVEGIPVDLEIIGAYLFAASGDQGVQVVYVQDPTHPRVIGRAQPEGLTLDLAVNWQPAAENQPGGLFVFVAKNDEGLEILKGTTVVEPVRMGLYQTPGMAPPAQVIRDGFPLVAKSDREKSVRTVRSYCLDIGLIGLGGYLFWIAFFAQFVLPLRRLKDRVQAIGRLLIYPVGAHGPAVRIENGRVKQRVGEEKRRGPGVILLDTASAAMLRTKTFFTRVIGPGVVFTKAGEYLHDEIIDLHPRYYPSPPLGPEPEQDPFAPPRRGLDGESDEAYQERQRRRQQTSAFTRDGIEVVARIMTVVRIRAERGQGGTQFGFDPRSVRLAITREGIAPKELRHMAWYEIPAYLAVDIWREYLGKFTLTELFETDPDRIHQVYQSAEPRDETKLERIIRMVVERLTNPEVYEIDHYGNLTSKKVPSREYQLLREMGVLVARVSISGVRFPPSVESQLALQWVSTWQERASRQREEVDKNRRQAILEGQKDATVQFARSVSQQFGDVLIQSGSQEADPPDADLPDLRASLLLLLENTRKLSDQLPDPYRLTEEEQQQLSRLLEWVRRTRS